MIVCESIPGLKTNTFHASPFMRITNKCPRASRIFPRAVCVRRIMPSGFGSRDTLCSSTLTFEFIGNETAVNESFGMYRNVSVFSHSQPSSPSGVNHETLSAELRHLMARRKNNGRTKLWALWKMCVWNITCLERGEVISHPRPYHGMNNDTGFSLLILCRNRRANVLK